MDDFAIADAPSPDSSHAPRSGDHPLAGPGGQASGARWMKSAAPAPSSSSMGSM